MMLAHYQNQRARKHAEDDDEEIIIVTTLTDSKQYSAEEIAELYGLRCNVEIDICSVKSKIGMCDLRSQT